MLLIVFVVSQAPAAMADAPYFSYYYGFFGYPIETVPGYLPDGVYTGDALGIGHFRTPTDMSVSSDGEVFILDAGNGRIVVLRAEGRELVLGRVINPVFGDGAEIELTDPQGIFIDDDGTIFVADSGGRTVWCLDREGVLMYTLERPDSDILPVGFDFRPQSVIVDSSNVIYVLSTDSAGSYVGSLMFDKSRNFLGFFGSETMRLNPWDRIQRLWRVFMTDEQRQRMSAFVPETINAFDIGPDGFVYTVRSNATGFRGQVRKLNSMGRNVLRTDWGPGDRMIFGDMQNFFDPQLGFIETSLIGISVDDDGFINILDVARSRVFQYDSYCNLLFVFGGPDIKKGTFRTVTAIETLGSSVLVLDTDFNSMTLFRPTAFAEEVRAALLLYRDGRYQEAVTHWEQVLKHDATYPMANKGMGKAMMQIGDFRAAMGYFRLARAPDGYSDALYYYRTEWMQENFLLIVIGLFILLALFITVSIIRSRRKRDEYASIGGKWKFPFYCMFHPIKGYSDMKYEKKGSILYANIIIGAFFLTSILVFWLTGFAYNFNDAETFNIIFRLISSVGLFVAWAITNWAVGAIIDGESTFKETWCFSAYALLPYIVVTNILTLMTNVFTWHEEAFVMLLYYTAFIWSGFNMLIALKEAHQFSMKKTILTSLLTVCGLILVVMIVTIGYSMIVQLFAFITSISNELALRT
jgi:DNA-binding beta-propeller fold protein YncE